jgi:hypothetical protein
MKSLLAVGVSLFVLAAGACGHRESKGEAHPADSAVAPTVSVAAALSLGGDPVERSATAATYRDGQLDECVDFTLRGPAGTEPAKVEAAIGFQLRPSTTPGESKTRVEHPCDQEFRDRRAVAKCRVPLRSIGNDSTWSASTLAVYYRRETAIARAEFKTQCAQVSGEWEEAPP